MANENLRDRRYVPTQPFDTDDPPRFSQLTETAKDAFVSELTAFFDIYTADDALEKIQTTPNVQKFAISSTGGVDNLETVVNLINSYADTPDRFPMIAVTSATMRERKLGIGSNYVVAVQYPPRVEGTKTGPFNIQADWQIELVTWPGGVQRSSRTSVIEFQGILFPDMANATIDDVVHAINAQALYYTAVATSDGRLRLKTGGQAAKAVPNYIEITGGTPECLNTLGLTVGQSDSHLNPARPRMNRYGIAGDMTINLDVVTDSLNTRAELSDLLFNFFTFYKEKRFFQMLGRSYQDDELDPPEWYHIILLNQFAWSGELNTPRQGGDQRDYLYANRASVPITIVDYIDRKIVEEPVFLDPDLVIQTDELPVGDYGGPNFKQPK